MEYAISAKETKYKDIMFRSRLEAKWACFFDLVGWDWIYEPFDLDGWTPDFLIKGTQDILVEVKPITEFHYATCKKIDKAYPMGRVMLLGCRPMVSSYYTKKDGSILINKDGFCWFRSALHIGWAKELDVFVSNFKPNKNKTLYAWTIAEMAHFKDLDLWGIENNGYGDYEKFDAIIFRYEEDDIIDKENHRDLNGKESSIWNLAVNKTRFKYKTR
jgi:hypothetical protein